MRHNSIMNILGGLRAVSTPYVYLTVYIKRT